MATLTKEVIEAAIAGFEAQKDHIDGQIADLRSMLGSSTRTIAEGADGPKRHFSAAARQRMKEAQQRRWANVKGESAASKPTKKPKRRLSAAGRANIVAALKKRWAVKKAATMPAPSPVAKKAARKKAA